MGNNDFSRALMSFLIAAILLVGLLYYFFGKPGTFGIGSKAEHEESVCPKDFACAEKQVAQMEELAHEAPLRVYGMALRAAYRRKDCALARELLNGAERVPVVEPLLVAARRKSIAAHAGACGDLRAPVPQPAPPPPDARVVVEHARCYGNCPAYTLTVHPDGLMEWEGKSDVAAKGRATRHIGHDAAREIFDLLERVHFTSLDKEYLSNATDLALTRVTLERGSVNHSVVADGACKTRASIEAGLCYLTSRIDELAEASKLIEARDE